MKAANRFAGALALAASEIEFVNGHLYQYFDVPPLGAELARAEVQNVVVPADGDTVEMA